MALNLPRILSRAWGYALNNVLSEMDARLIVVEQATQAVVGPQGPPGTGVHVDPLYDGLEMHFGPGPLPDPATFANKVYVMLPPNLS